MGNPIIQMELSGHSMVVRAEGDSYSELTASISILPNMDDTMGIELSLDWAQASALHATLGVIIKTIEFEYGVRAEIAKNHWRNDN